MRHLRVWTRQGVVVVIVVVVTTLQASVLATDCNQNGIEDPLEVASGAAPDCNSDMVPDECDVLPVSFDLAGPTLNVGTTGGPLVLADYDGDERLDLLAGGSTSLAMLPGDGAGGFGALVRIINARCRRFLQA